MNKNASICHNLSFLLLLPGLLLLTLAGCRKHSLPEMEDEPGISVDLTIGLGDHLLATRAGASAGLTEAETAINRIQLMIYHHRGSTVYLEKELNFGHFVEGTDDNGIPQLRTLSPIELIAGAKTILVSINGPINAAPSSPEAFELSGPYLISSFNNPEVQFWLYGSLSTIINKQTSGLDLHVRRLVGRISITAISNNLSGGQDISSIYAFLANAAGHMYASPEPYPESYIFNPDGRVGSVPWNGDHSPKGSYITGKGICTSVCSELMSQTIPAIPSGEVYATPRYLYACPQHEDIPWSPWLVLAAEIDGVFFYYNIPVDRFQANVNQNVSITLRSLGSPEPCVPNDPGAYEISLIPDGWRAESGEEII